MKIFLDLDPSLLNQTKIDRYAKNDAKLTPLSDKYVLD